RAGPPRRASEALWGSPSGQARSAEAREACRWRGHSERRVPRGNCGAEKPGETAPMRSGSEEEPARVAAARRARRGAAWATRGVAGWPSGVGVGAGASASAASATASSAAIAAAAAARRRVACARGVAMAVAVLGRFGRGLGGDLGRHLAGDPVLVRPPALLTAAEVEILEPLLERIEVVAALPAPQLLHVR